MKKIISTLLTIAMLISIVNIPVTMASENEITLLDIAEDYTTISASDLTGCTFTQSGDIATVGLVQGEGLKIEHINPVAESTGLNSGIEKVFERKVEDPANRTVLTQTEFQGKYEITVDIDLEFITDSGAFGYFYLDGIQTKIDTSKKWDVRKAGPVGTRDKTLGYGNDKNALVTYTVDTENDTVAVNVDGSSIDLDITKDIQKIEKITVKTMDKFSAGTYFTLKNLKVKQLETEGALATLAVVNSLPVSFPESVTENLTIEAIDGVTWTSSNPAVVSAEGVVTRPTDADAQVVLTATVDLNNDGGIFTKEYTLTVPKVVIPEGGENEGGENEGGENEGGDDPVIPPVEPPVMDDDKIISYTDFTQYSDIDDIPNLTYINDEYAIVKVEKGKGLIVEQIKSEPLNGDGAQNGATKAQRVIFMAESTFNHNDAERSNYRVNKHFGQFRITTEYEVVCDPYSGPVLNDNGESVTISAPYYQYIVSTINPEKWSAAAAWYSRLYTANTQMYGADSGNKAKISYKNSGSGVVHTAEIEVNIDKDPATGNAIKDVNKITVDGIAGKKNALHAKADYINGFYIVDMQRNLLGSKLVIKSFKIEEIEADANTKSAIAALEQIPAFIADPYAVTENLVLPNVGENVLWSSSDSEIITNEGVITRWYDDRDVTLTATATVGNAVVYKDYKITVKAVDSYEKKDIMNNSGEALEDVYCSGDMAVASTVVSTDGLVVAKAIDGEDASSETPVYFADYRLFGEEVAYNESTRESVLTAGYAGIYDVAFNLKPSISGDKPIYVALGSDNGAYKNVASLRISNNAIHFAGKDGSVKVYSGETNGESFDIRFRVDTENKKVWLFVDGKLVGSPFAYESIDFVDSLRVTIDKNNKKGDKVTLNNITVTEIVKNDVSLRNDMLSALASIDVNDVTTLLADGTIETIKSLPAKAGEYDIIWSADDSVDLEKCQVYFSRNPQNVVISAMVSGGGVYVKKNFNLTIRAAKNDDEVLGYCISDLADTITKQKANDIRYDLNLPLEHNGVSITWTSSKPQIISNSGKINKDAAIVNPTEVALTANITMNGENYTRTYNYIVSPRAYNNVIYSGSGDAKSITVNGYNNIKISRDSVTNIKFSSTDNGTITFADNSGKTIAVVNVNNGVYYVTYGGGLSQSYPIADGEVVELDVMVMPDIDKIAVWADGERIVDFADTLEKIDNLAKVDASDAISVTETIISTDEYGVLDINFDNVPYFGVFEKNVITGSVDLVKDKVFDCNIGWVSNDLEDKVIDDNGVVTAPSKHSVEAMTLTLTSAKDSTVKRVVEKTFVVACDSKYNLALNKATKSSVSEKAGFGKIYLNDGKYDTVYGTANASKKPVLTIDFGEPTYFNTLFVNEDVVTNGRSLKSYTVSYSNDGENWTVAKQGTVSDIESSIITFNTVVARYVSFTAEECDDKELYINEIEAYLFVDSAELVKLEIDTLDFTTGSAVKGDLVLPATGKFGTPLTWTSDKPEIISNTGKYTKPSVSTTVTLTVTANFGDDKYSKKYAAYVPAGSSGSGGGAGGSGGGAGGGYISGAGNGVSTIPGFIETDAEEEAVITPEDTTSLFSDMPSSHWAYENVKKLKELGIIDGVGDNKFNPSGKVTREQFLKMLVEVVDADVKMNTTSFSDVDASAWYAPYVSTGVELGLINGITDDTFGVGAEIKRQDMAVLIVRILNSKGVVVTQTSETFDDENEISDYAKDAVYKVRDAGIINGYADNTFAPEASLTRAEAATVIVKLLEVMQ